GVASNITDASGQFLDGDGNGVGGDNFTFLESQGLYRLFGEVNGDKAVNGLDLGAFRNAFNTNSDQSAFLWFFDVNADGVIRQRTDQDTVDQYYERFVANFGVTIY